MLLYKLEFNWIELIKSILPFIIISAGFCFFAIKYLREKTTGYKILSTFLMVISIIFFFMLILNLSGSIAEYKKYEAVITNKTFETVSGYISDFKPADPSGRGEETFSINGIKFSYVHYEDYVGYHTASTKGGIITENGQLLTINYVYDSSLGRNVILEIRSPQQED